MKPWLFAITSAAILWLVLFASSIPFYPLVEKHPFIFHNTMVVLAVIAILVATRFGFKQVSAEYLKTGLFLGVVWFVVNLAIDLPVFLGIFNFTSYKYFSEIGSSYPIFIIVPTLCGWILDQKKA